MIELVKISVHRQSWVMASRVFIVQLFVLFDWLEYFHSEMSRRKNKHPILFNKAPLLRSPSLPSPPPALEIAL